MDCFRQSDVFAIIVVAPAGSALPLGAADKVLTRDWAATVRQGVYDCACVCALASVLFAVWSPVATAPTVLASQDVNIIKAVKINKRRRILMSYRVCGKYS